MPVTAEQAQMITTLALASRPHGARRWDAAGVMANIRKVSDRHLGDVVLAVIQAAEDRNAETPGVIPTNGPHWRAPDPSRPTDPARRVARQDRCSICGDPLDTHRLTDHEPKRNVRPEEPTVNVHATVVGLRGLIADARPDTTEETTS